MPNRLLTSRPLAKLLRYAYRYTHGPRMRHNEVLWPFVRLQRDAGGRLLSCTVRGAPPLPLADLDTVPRHGGGPAHLILSGPSIRDIDYGRLALPNAMGVNGAIALLDAYPQIRFRYYAMLDEGFLRRRIPLVRRILAQDLLLFATPEIVRAIAQRFDPAEIRCRIAVFEEVHQRAGLPRPTPDELEAALGTDADLVLFDAHNAHHAHGFSLDVSRGLYGGGTVAYSALQILVWLGFRDICIHGLDLTQANDTARFYETREKRLGTALSREFAGHIEPAFRAAARLLRERGVRVRNLSPHSALGDDIFPRVPWQTLADPVQASTDSSISSAVRTSQKLTNALDNPIR